MEFNIQGLTQAEAAERLRKDGPNSLKRPEKARGLRLFFSQFKSPLILLLIGAGILSFSLGGRIDSSIICTIVVLSGLLGFFQERGAIHSLEKLLKLVETKAMVRREGKEEEIPLEQVVVGDIVVLNAGDIVPADCQVIEANRLFVDESTLTGESVPVEKGKEQPL
ncbi:MAG TPA: HAD-IC family P-type ATPase, partial [Chlamydiales bacterium]|nr:HAD-IC family P-type ATPase [Chlamydiales bacterium]